MKIGHIPYENPAVQDSATSLIFPLLETRGNEGFLTLFLGGPKIIQKIYARGPNEQHSLSFLYISIYSRGDQGPNYTGWWAGFGLRAAC